MSSAHITIGKRQYKLEKFSEGGASTLYEIVGSNKPLLVKIPKQTQGIIYVQAFQNECRMLRTFKGCPNIINVYTSNDEALVLPKMKGTLSELLDAQPQRKLPVETAKRIFKTICKAIKSCHSKQVAHLDVKLENILRDNNEKLYLSDFGSACTTYNHGEVLVTPRYSAPEILFGTCKNPIAADIWSLGVVLYELLNGKLPFSDPTNIHRLKHFHKHLISKFPGPLGNLLHSMFHLNPESRITIQEVLHHPWLRSCKKSTPFDKVRKGLSKALNSVHDF